MELVLAIFLLEVVPMTANWKTIMFKMVCGLEEVLCGSQ